MNTELFGRATDYARGVLSELTYDDLRRPTPCDGWDAGRVVLHLADVIDALIGLVDTGTLGLPQPPRTNDPDLVALVDERLANLAHAFSVAADATKPPGCARRASADFLTGNGSAPHRVHCTTSTPFLSADFARTVQRIAIP